MSKEQLFSMDRSRARAAKRAAGAALQSVGLDIPYRLDVTPFQPHDSAEMGDGVSTDVGWAVRIRTPDAADAEHLLRYFPTDTLVKIENVDVPTAYPLEAGQA